MLCHGQHALSDIRIKRAGLAGEHPDVVAAYVASVTGKGALQVVILSFGEAHGSGLYTELEQHPAVNAVHVCNDEYSAREVCSTSAPVVIFAPLSTMLSMRQQVPVGCRWVVMGESNDDALAAFSACASSFLPLPLTVDNIHRCMAQLLSETKRLQFRRQYQQVTEGLCRQFGVTPHALSAMLRRQCASRNEPGVVGLKSGSEWRCLHPHDIRWIEAAGDYMCVYTLGENHIVRSTLSDLLKKLDNTRFLRASRSVIANVDCVAEIETVTPSLHILHLDDGTQVKISRRCYIAHWQQRQKDDRAGQRSR
ncbi:LytTR family transcriptional regulator [Alteromonas sp. ASW11-19]|uniref:LytTR family transcriptional regulator n=1 Tax=Alteromonas salexigens TaxID=2982530 RepID=A0ABT2VPP8_9ALTE|nr:LytTR family DNA-binding domain-containing protein [Alteromonas salexigens]MCU7554837.1 LytTR family transcriptional regulator [Alteromonas salexigens]